MTHVIAEPCIGVKDKACVPACPVDCIQEGERMLYIIPAECIDCGACIEPCPVQAIFPADELPAKWKFYEEINQRWATNGHNDAAAWEGFTPAEAAKKTW
ncbi:MAG: ferredoxin family protein [Planctomycetes bacterium]|nr:ferredoxin family protein [Planctomycetota bacterium]